MPAGGTWTVQNKRRPGAYINFVAVPKPMGTMGDRGIVTAAIPMTWGPSDKLIEVYGDELLNGASLLKVGCTAADTEESLPYRLLLGNCHKALIYRTDAGGVKATATLESGKITFVAKYAGTTGNKITITVTKDKPKPGQYQVCVVVNKLIKETFVVAALADFKTIDSEWVDITVAASPVNQTIPETAGISLTNGTNGTVSSDVYARYFALVDTAIWQCMAIETTDATIPPLVAAKIKTLRDSRGKKVQAVVYNDNSANYEGIICVKQGFRTETDLVGKHLFPLWVASVTAGSNVNQSNTALVVPGAVEIIDSIVEDEIGNQLAAGWFLLSYRQDGAVCVEQDINSLCSFTADKNYAFSKNRVIRCLDEIGNSTALIYSRNYMGKVDNDNNGRNLYKSELIAMCERLQGIGAIKNFDGPADITVLQGEAIDAVVADLVIQPTDSMEKLYMTVNVDA